MLIWAHLASAFGQVAIQFRELVEVHDRFFVMWAGQLLIFLKQRLVEMHIRQFEQNTLSFIGFEMPWIRFQPGLRVVLDLVQSLNRRHFHFDVLAGDRVVADRLGVVARQSQILQREIADETDGRLNGRLGGFFILARNDAVIVLVDFAGGGCFHAAFHEPGVRQPAYLRRLVLDKLFKFGLGFAHGDGPFFIGVVLALVDIRAGLIEDIDGDIEADLLELPLKEGFELRVARILEGRFDGLDGRLKVLAGLNEHFLGRPGAFVAGARLIFAHRLG